MIGSKKKELTMLRNARQGKKPVIPEGIELAEIIQNYVDIMEDKGDLSPSKREASTTANDEKLLSLFDRMVGDIPESELDPVKCQEYAKNILAYLQDNINQDFLTFYSTNSIDKEVKKNHDIYLKTAKILLCESNQHTVENFKKMLYILDNMVKEKGTMPGVCIHMLAMLYDIAGEQLIKKKNSITCAKGMASGTALFTKQVQSIERSRNKKNDMSAKQVRDAAHSFVYGFVKDNFIGQLKKIEKEIGSSRINCSVMACLIQSLFQNPKKDLNEIKREAFKKYENVTADEDLTYNDDAFNEAIVKLLALFKKIGNQLSNPNSYLFGQYMGSLTQSYNEAITKLPPELLTNTLKAELSKYFASNEFFKNVCMSTSDEPLKKQKRLK